MTALIIAGLTILLLPPAFSGAASNKKPKKNKSAIKVNPILESSFADARKQATKPDRKATFSLNKRDKNALSAHKEAENLRDQAEDIRGKAHVYADRIAKIEELLEAAEYDEARLRSQLEERIVAAYKSGENSDLAFLLSADGLGDAVERTEMINKRTADDQKLLEDYELSVTRLEELKMALEELQSLQEERAANLDLQAINLDRKIQTARSFHVEKKSEKGEQLRRAEIEGRIDHSEKDTWYVLNPKQEDMFSFRFSGMMTQNDWTGGARTPARPATPAQIARVLADPRIQLDSSGIMDVQNGAIDGRLLDALTLMGQRFGSIIVTSLKSDHGVYTTSGNVSMHSYGCAADIGTVAGQLITPSAQGPGTITEESVLFLSSLQGDLAPHQVITLYSYGGPSVAMGDHGDHIHLGYHC